MKTSTGARPARETALRRASVRTSAETSRSRTGKPVASRAYAACGPRARTDGYQTHPTIGFPSVVRASSATTIVPTGSGPVGCGNRGRIANATVAQAATIAQTETIRTSTVLQSSTGDERLGK